MSVWFWMSAAKARAVGAILGLIAGTTLLWLRQPAASAPSSAPPAPAAPSTSAPSTPAQEEVVVVFLPPAPGPRPVGPRKTSPKAQGMLGVNAVPGNVKVYIDGRLWKHSVPFEVLLPVGPHIVAFEETKASARTVRTVIIKANEHAQIVERM
jgi:hypothetical protein